MLKVSAYTFISIGSGIDHLQITLGLIGDDKPPYAEALEEYERLLNFIRKKCSAMALSHTEGIIGSIQTEQGGKDLSNGDIRGALKEINRSLVQELDNELFLHVNAESAKSFCRPDPFGPNVSKQFSSCMGNVLGCRKLFGPRIDRRLRISSDART